jgi:hypothetical protein
MGSKDKELFVFDTVPVRLRITRDKPSHCGGFAMLKHLPGSQARKSTIPLEASKRSNIFLTFYNWLNMGEIIL